MRCRNTKLVQFADASWGVRYGRFFYTYQDFKDRKYRWAKSSIHFQDCCCDEFTARTFYNRVCVEERVVQ